MPEELQLVEASGQRNREVLESHLVDTVNLTLGDAN
jgi:hypothetical protein